MGRLAAALELLRVQKVLPTITRCPRRLSQTWLRRAKSGTAAATQIGLTRHWQDEKTAVKGHLTQPADPLALSPSDPLVAVLYLIGCGTKDNYHKPAIPGIHSRVQPPFANGNGTAEIVEILEDGLDFSVQGEQGTRLLKSRWLDEAVSLRRVRHLRELHE